MPNQQSETRERPKIKVEEPRMYNVIMHNDDFTTMEFVVKVLRTVFFKPEHEAIELMLTVHKSDQAVVGRYTYDIAVSKCNKAMQMAHDAGYPFRVTYEEDDNLPF